jgi:hypothetical protein
LSLSGFAAEMVRSVMAIVMAGHLSSGCRYLAWLETRFVRG